VSLSQDLEAAGATLLGVARERGLLVGRDRPDGDAPGLCPTGCDGGRRGKEATNYHARDGWCCHRCGAGGGVLELLLALDKQRVPAVGDRAGWREARAACERQWRPLEPAAPGVRRKAAPAPEPEPLIPAHEGQCEPWAAELAEALGLLPDRPPEAEMEALRRACVRVTRDPEVSGWLKSRGLPPECVEEMNLAGALPLGAPELPWARFKGRSWAAGGWRLVVPAYDAHGALRSFRARLVTGEAGVPKELPPGGFKAAGLMLCCPRARELLKSGTGADEVWVVEGVPDWLSLALLLEARRRKGGAPAAVFGGWAGSWGALCRLPAGVRVLVATDGDRPGDEYAEAIRAAVPRGVECARRRRPAGDWNDLVREVRGE
jgi:hypothetical protein